MLNKAIKKAKENKKGFTLAELLIVVAIIAVLVAISIPIFTSQLEKAREATYAANIRSAYASASADVLDDGKLDTSSYTYSGNTYNVTYDADTQKITVTATINGVDYSFDGNTFSGFTKITPGKDTSVTTQG